MARMHPRDCQPTDSDAERYVFHALRRRLPESWSVVHSQRIFLPASDTRDAFEGEIDFVALAPGLGVLCLEVKGGGIERTAEGWFSVDRRGRRHRIRDPGQQAQAACHALHRYLGDRRERVPVVWGVILPDVEVRSDLGPGLPRDLLLDRDAFADPEDALRRLFRKHGRDGRSFDRGAAQRVLDLLAPAARLIRPLAAVIDQEQQALLRLTDDQARLLDHLERIPRCAIEGAAGTGKTVLAAEKARRLAAEGREVLLLCFNRPLAEHLQRELPEVRVSNFHGLCIDLAQETGLPHAVPKDPRAARRFWRDEAPDLLDRALKALPDRRFDAVIVDEGQDFFEEWWLVIDELLREPGAGTLYVFHDPRQNIYGGSIAGTIGAAEFPLRENCRNTARVAEFAYAQIGERPTLRPGAPEGEQVVEETCADEAEMARAAERHLRRIHVEGRVRAEQIAVLSTRATRRSALANSRRIAGLELVPLEEASAPNHVRFASLHRFKGLEADVVLLVDVEPGARNSSPAHLYVAASRARHLLVVLRYASEAAAP